MGKLDKFMREDDPLAYGAAALYPYTVAMVKKYRFTSRFGDDVLLHRVVPEGIELPRALCEVTGPNEKLDWGQAVNFPRIPHPRPEQEKVFAKTVQALKDGRSGIVVAHTGWGKTLLGLYAAGALGVKTLVVTTKEDIYEQWIMRAHQYLGLASTEIGEIRGDKCEIIDAKFCVALVQSLSKDAKYPPEVTKGFGLLIVDEVHRMAADQFQKIMWMFPAAIRLGLSATLSRSDGKDLLLHAHIGPVIAQTEHEGMVPKVLRFKSGWHCPRTVKVVTDPETGGKKRVYPPIPHEPGKTAHIEKIIAHNGNRNEMLADLIKSAYDKKRRIVVFTTSHKHCELLTVACKKAGVKAKDMGHYKGAHTKSIEAANEAAMGKPVVFTTYIMMGEGTDWPWLDTAILAMPRANVAQPVGRIRREYDDKHDLVVMDVVDDDSEVFAGYSYARLKWYKSIGAEVKDMEL